MKIKETMFPSAEFHSADLSVIQLSQNQKDLVSLFNDRVKSGEVEFEEIDCLCGNGEFNLIGEYDRYGFLQQTVVCTDCGLVQSNPRMSQKEIINFYSSDFYRSCYESENYLELYKKEYYNRENVRHIFDEVSQNCDFKSKPSVLEFGAGGGWNLLPFIDSGATVLGMDLSPSLVALGQSQDIPMKQGGIDDIEGVYDVIVLNHVLEHFSDPFDCLKTLVTHLKLNGVIYIGVPNILNFGKGQIQNAHTYYFSPSTFLYYCSKIGLEAIASGKAEEIHMFGLFKLGLAQDYQIKKPSSSDIITKLRKARIKSNILSLLSLFYLDNVVRRVWRFIRY